MDFLFGRYFSVFSVGSTRLIWAATHAMCVCLCVCEFICLFAFAFTVCLWLGVCVCVCATLYARVKFCFYRKFTRSEIHAGDTNNSSNSILYTVRCDGGGRKSIVSNLILIAFGWNLCLCNFSKRKTRWRSFGVSECTSPNDLSFSFDKCTQFGNTPTMLAMTKDTHTHTRQDTGHTQTHICSGDAAKHMRHTIISVHATVYSKLLIREVKHTKRTPSASKRYRGGVGVAARINPSHFLHS